MIKGPQASWKIIFLFVVLAVFASLTASSNTPPEIDPSSWTTTQLKRYLDDHNIDYKSQHASGHSDYLKLVDEYRHSIKGSAESAAEWLRKQTDYAGAQLQTAEEVAASFAERIKTDLQTRKILTEAQLNAFMIDLRGQVTAFKDWGAIKEAQTEKFYDDIKRSLNKQATLKKADTEVVLQSIKRQFEATVNDYTASASKLGASAQSTGNDAYHYVTSKVAHAYKSAASVVSDAIYHGASSVSDKASATASSASSTASNVADSASSVASAASSAASSAGSAASSAASSAGSAAYNSASSAYSSVTSAAAETASNAYESTAEYADSALNSIRARLVGTKDWSEDQVNGVLAYINDNLHKGRVTSEKQINSIVDGVNTYLVEKKEASKEQIASTVKSVREELEKWRLNLPWVKKEEL